MAKDNEGLGESVNDHLDNTDSRLFCESQAMIIRYNQKLEPLRRIFDSDILFNRPDSNEIIRFCYKLQDSVSKTVAKFTENRKSD